MLITIVLAGQAQNARMREAIFQLLSKKFLVYHRKALSVMQNGAGTPDFLLLESSEIPEIFLPDSLLVLGKAEVKIKMTQPVATVLNSSCEQAVEAARRLSLPAVTCGSRQTDTVTFSSQSEEEVLLSLQRTVYTIGGCCYDPIELPIYPPNGLDTETTLLLCGVFLLIDQLALLQKNDD